MITGQVRIISSPIQKKASSMQPPLFYELWRQRGKEHVRGLGSGNETRHMVVPPPFN